MSKVSEKFSSMYLTMWVLVFLLVWIGLGLYMAGTELYFKPFQMMNNMLIRDWLLSGKTGAGFLKTWFIILCAAIVVLGVNLIFCTWSKIFRIMRARFSGNQLFMLIVHAIFGFVAIGHLGGFMLGFEYNNIRLGKDIKQSVKEGYEIEVKDVHFVGDTKALAKSKRDLTRDDLDYKESYVDVSLLRDGVILKRQKVFLLDPMNYKDVHVTLRSFVLPENFKGEPGPDTEAWAMFTLSRNPALKMFLLIYPVMIAGIFIYLIMTWRKSSFIQNNNNKNQ
ncbi:MAG: hypothetical protein JXL81_07060 [Deltaproteobacteria bacterium]|nr:hypothetical protein [Deltaproteobacteria bacterium]